MQKLIKYKIISFFLLSFPSVLCANISVQNNPIVGGIAALDFDSNHANPKAYYNKTPLYVQRIKNQRWQVLFGIPLLTKAGKKQIVIKDFGEQYLNFEVKESEYKSQHITLKGKNKKYLNPNLAHMDRIMQERPILTKARKTFSPDLLANGSFIRPVDGVITSPFGLKRFYNGEARRPHTGIDFAGEIGTNIKAPNDGVVILTGDFFFNGKTVFINHGQGLISAYIHLNTISVQSGQTLKQGDIIGGIGQTGRANGAHLHWTVYLNQTAINPKLLLKADAF